LPFSLTIPTPSNGATRHRNERVTFHIGAAFQGNVRRGEGSIFGHYHLTTKPAEAVIGVYLPESVATHHLVTASREPLTHFKYVPDAAPPPPPNAEHGECDNARFFMKGHPDYRLPMAKAAVGVHTRHDNGTFTGTVGRDHPIHATPRHAALAEPAAQYLNRVGSSLSAPNGVLSTQCQTGRVSCPRTWFIYTERPPHISPVAWAAKVPQTRDVHRRWILNLHSMSRSLLGIELHQAALELVRRMRVQQNWKWSMTARAFIDITAALRNLPFYTNQTKGINLAEHPEWREAVQTANTLQKQEIAEPPPPVTYEEYVKARRILDTKSPHASLYLSLMWNFAARAGDIQMLQARDVILGAETTEDSVGQANGTTLPVFHAAVTPEQALTPESDPRSFASRLQPVILQMRRGKVIAS